MTLIKCNDVSFAYEGNIVATNLNFEVSAGNYLCVIGENGSGKSTLIKGLLGLKAPCKGKIELSGLRKNEVGYLPQQTAAQKDFPASVFEVVLSGRLSSSNMKCFYNREDKYVVNENLKKLGITELKNRCYRELSGGQQQRVLLARALCATRRIILLDEPVAGLDPLVTQELYELISKINKELGIAVIMVSHDIRSTIKYATHILHMQNHQLFYGTNEEYMNSDLWGHLSGGVN